MKKSTKPTKTKTAKAAKHAQWQRENSPRVWEHRLKSFYRVQETWTDEHRIQQAGLLVRHGVRVGRIHKPAACEACKTPTARRRLQGHHRDYKWPLDVTWCCPKCHAVWDAARRAKLTKKTRKPKAKPRKPKKGVTL